MWTLRTRGERIVGYVAIATLVILITLCGISLAASCEPSTSPPLTPATVTPTESTVSE